MLAAIEERYRTMLRVFLALCACCNAFGQTYTINTVQGSVLPLNSLQFPGADGASTGPRYVAVDSGGNLYFPVGAIVVRLDALTGIPTVVAGGGMKFPGDNGPATSAEFCCADGVAVDSSGNLFIADGARVRKVSNGVITTVAGNGTTGFSGDGGPATSAELNNEYGGIAVDSAGNLYIGDRANRRVREVTNGVITTIAGNGSPGFAGDNGPATSAQLTPSDCAVDSVGNLYIADVENQRVRKVSNGVITTVAGGGENQIVNNVPATSVRLSTWGVAVDSAGNIIIADGNAHVFKVTNGLITTVAGNGTTGFSGDGGPATSAELGGPEQVALDSADNVYVADYENGRIRVLHPSAAPSINLNGIVPIDSSVSIIQSGSWVSIYGKYLANGTAVWNNAFPTSLGGVTATVDDKSAYLWSVSPTQINLQAPDDMTTGIVNVAVNTPNGTVNSTVVLAQYAPSFSLLGDGKHVAGVIATPNGNGAYGGGTYDLVGPSNSFSFSTRPVQQGETLILYGVGFGPTTPHVPAGQPFNGIASTNSPVTITIGGVPANVSFSGITEAGLYQINLAARGNSRFFTSEPVTS